jgi:hypothetical protein
LLEKEKGGGQKRATVMVWQPFYRGVVGRRGRGGGIPAQAQPRDRRGSGELGAAVGRRWAADNGSRPVGVGRRCALMWVGEGEWDADWWASTTVTGGGCLICFKFKFKTISNQVQIISNFDWPKQYIPEFKKIEIKYGWEGFEERNNFVHWNFSWFVMYFKWKFREVSRLGIQ